MPRARVVFRLAAYRRQSKRTGSDSRPRNTRLSARRREALRYLTTRGLMTPRRPFVQTPELSPAELTALCVEVGLDPPY